MFFKPDKERGFAYTTHTACDSNGMVIGFELTPGNIHDVNMLFPLVDSISDKIEKPEIVVVDAGYKSAAVAHVMEEKEIQLVIPYRNNNKTKSKFRKSSFKYDPEENTYICPMNEIMKPTTVDKDGQVTYRCARGTCKKCEKKTDCFTESYASKQIQRHIWESAVERADRYRRTPEGKIYYSGRKETIERVFADGKEQHAMRYTRLRGIEKVTDEVYLIFACMNLKKMISKLKKEEVNAA